MEKLFIDHKIKVYDYQYFLSKALLMIDQSKDKLEIEIAFREEYNKVLEYQIENGKKSFWSRFFKFMIEIYRDGNKSLKEK